VKRSYQTQPRVVTQGIEEMPFLLEEVCRRKLSELFQALLEAEVDAALERLRYERQSPETKAGYRDGHDRGRTIASNRGPIDVRRPRVRGASFQSEVLPKHRRRLQSVDRSVTELWLEGLSTRDFEGTLRAFLGVEAPLSAATITRTNRRLLADYAAWNERRLGALAERRSPARRRKWLTRGRGPSRSLCKVNRASSPFGTCALGILSLLLTTASEKSRSPSHAITPTARQHQARPRADR
jgi:hypothetical protein